MEITRLILLILTALLGWEWSSIPAGANLHRVIVTNANAEQALAMDAPFEEPATIQERAYTSPIWYQPD